MPTYNRVDLLPETIKTILSQDYEDLELLIVDDGSTDKTAEVIKEIQAQDQRLRYIQLPENRGIGFARQAGLEHISGIFIALADSDDLWLPGKLTSQIDVLEKHPEIEILFGDFWNIDCIRGTEASGFAESQTGMKHLVVRPLADDLWLVEGGIEIGILKSNFIAVPTMVIRASVFKKVGGFDTNLGTREDFEFNWRAAVLGAQFAYLNQLLIERYRNESSVTARTIETKVGDKLKALKTCRQTYEMARRPDLVIQIRAAEHHAWRKLLWMYGHNGQRARAFRAYGKNLHCGFSTRNLLVFGAALMGPQAASLALSFIKRVRATSS